MRSHWLTAQVTPDQSVSLSQIHPSQYPMTFNFVDMNWVQELDFLEQQLWSRRSGINRLDEQRLFWCCRTWPRHRPRDKWWAVNLLIFQIFRWPYSAWSWACLEFTWCCHSRFLSDVYAKGTTLSGCGGGLAAWPGQLPRVAPQSPHFCHFRAYQACFKSL